MKQFNVKFGTPAPIKFREYDKDHPDIDLELEVRAAGDSTVSAYDDVLYGNSEEFVSKVREVALSSLSDCIRTWPEGRSFWKNTTRAELEKYIDERLSEHGITAKTELCSLALTPESAEIYYTAVNEASKSKMFVDIISPYKNIIDENEGQPRTGKSLFDGFPMGKNPLAPSSDDKMANLDGTMVMGSVPNGSQITASKDKYCRSCGAKRKEGAKFCTECGEKFD
jgi:membrane protease subunit (stomatin/prohibitin family)